jgi:hypothetical protein
MTVLVLGVQKKEDRRRSKLKFALLSFYSFARKVDCHLREFQGGTARLNTTSCIWYVQSDLLLQCSEA